MAGLAFDTGGVFFENDNDLEAGFRKTAGLADAFYLLAFSPQDLKHDGAFHPIKVKLVSWKGLSVQARHGYYAPKRSEDRGLAERGKKFEKQSSPRRRPTTSPLTSTPNFS